MKIKTVGKLIIIFSVLAFLWMMSATASPIKPNRIKKYPICYITPPSHIDFVYRPSSAKFKPPNFMNLCKFDIPEMELYKALTLNITYKLNQPAALEVGLTRKGMGPLFKPVEISSGNTDKFITSTWLLNDTDPPNKLNWLSGSYDKVAIRISKFDPSKELILSIYEVYLE